MRERNLSGPTLPNPKRALLTLRENNLGKKEAVGLTCMAETPLSTSPCPHHSVVLQWAARHVSASTIVFLCM